MIYSLCRRKTTEVRTEKVVSGDYFCADNQNKTARIKAKP